MEVDTANIHLQMKSLEQSHAQDTLELVLATGYLKKLLVNSNIKQYLIKNHPEIYSEFEAITKGNSNES